MQSFVMEEAQRTTLAPELVAKFNYQTVLRKAKSNYLLRREMP